jgi:carbamoyltransferase
VTPRPLRDAGSPTVLGLCAFTHDSAAALIVDGELVGFVEEERLSGIKHTRAYPQLAVDWLLAEAGIPAAQVTHVVYNFRAASYLTALAATPGHLAVAATRARALPRARSFARETQTTTIASATRKATGIGYRLLDAIDDPASLGYAYGAISEHLGWRRGDEEGTVMALAALGDPARFRDLLARAITLHETGFALDPTLFPIRVLSGRYPRVSPALVAACPARQPDGPVEQIHADLAAALQERTEQVMVHLARRARRLTNSGLLCLGGGVATNCVAAGRIAEGGWFDEVHVPPAPGDAGTAIGAAVAVHLDRTGWLPNRVAARPYLGPAYADPAPAAGPTSPLKTFRPANPARFLADRLAIGDIVGLFQGRVEAGPRALGNRSILASPLLTDVVTRLNATVKYREPFRPFAPVVLADKAGDYFVLRQPSPYMSLACPVTELARRQIPAIVHANGTARVQTVTADQNGFLADVLREFAAITDVPVLINTSLNVKGAPIAGTPDLALDCLTGSGLDALLMDGVWVSKR